MTMHLYDAYPCSTRDLDPEFDSSHALSLRNITYDLLREVDGPIVEIAGPSPDGFASLGTEKLPQKLIISNLHNVAGVNALLDARSLPFPARSLGGIIVSYLSFSPDTLTIDESWRNGALAEAITVMSRVKTECQTGDFSCFNNQEYLEYSQRFGFWKEARRTMQQGSVMVLKGGDDFELQLATEYLGYEYIGQTESSYCRQGRFKSKGMKLLTLRDMSTAAGLYIDQQTATI